MKIAIMQPYFLPYAGYFRLLYAADIFVIYDCVQFPRRGWVHRNYFRKFNGEYEFLTLPLIKTSQKQIIKNLEFRVEENIWIKNQNKFVYIRKIFEEFHELANILNNFSIAPLSYITSSIKYISKLFNYSTLFDCSSSLKIPDKIRGQDRIIEICKFYKAKEYINLFGGINLYDNEIFAKNNITLKILQNFSGERTNILENILTNSLTNVKNSIKDQTKFIN